MTDRRCISWRFMPPYAPIALTISVGLLLDRLSAPGWVWGLVGGFFGLVWLAYVVTFFKCEPLEPVFKGDKP